MKTCLRPPPASAKVYISCMLPLLLLLLLASNSITEFGWPELLLPSARGFGTVTCTACTALNPAVNTSWDAGCKGRHRVGKV